MHELNRAPVAPSGAPAADASPSPPTPARATSFKRLLVAAALAFAVVALFFLFVLRDRIRPPNHLAVDAHPAAVVAVPGPADAVRPLPEPVQAPAPAIPPGPSARSAPTSLAPDDLPLPIGAAALVHDVARSVAEAVAPVRSAVSQLADRVATYEANAKRQADDIASMRRDVDAAITRVQLALDRNANVTHARTASVPRAARSTETGQPTARDKPELLAVDMWGGKPVVVVARKTPEGTTLRFLTEGETQGTVRVHKADVVGQSATFTTPGGDVTLNAEE